MLAKDVLTASHLALPDGVLESWCSGRGDFHRQLL